ncbi:uncharacterized protein [Aristolochia californica]|uniref:uncharacterized protein n=1 Tax=Aristolochia californica TaxID=171875 RepID=UPI0035D7ACD4
MPKLTPFSLILLLLFFQYSSLEPVVASREAKLLYPFHKMKERKLEAEILGRDYDDPGPNTKHDPRKGKPGGGRQ